MAIHRADSRHLFTLNGMTRTTGGGNNLAKGEFTIVNKKQATANGAKVVTDFTALGQDSALEFRVGNSPVRETRSGNNAKAKAGHPFHFKDVVDMYASAPKTTVQRFDDLVVGYDGINDDTALTFEEGVTTVLDLIVKGEHIGFLTNNIEHTVKIHFGKELGETDQQVIERVVRRLQEYTFAEGIKLTDAVDIKIVNSETLALTGIPYVFSTLSLTDGGSSNDLALVQAQYPNYVVQPTSHVGQTSVYTILHPASVTLPAYVTTLAAYLKDCEDCLAGYTELQEGVIYSVTIEDDGADLSTTVDNAPGFIAGTARKIGNRHGVGTYTIAVDNALTDAEIATFVAASAVQGTATFTNIGPVGAQCYNNATSTTAWVDGDTCFATTEQYTIQLKDDDCDGSRLAELQAAYPNLVIEAGEATGRASQAITITGSSGDMSLVIAGVTYTTTYITSPTATAAAFVTAHAAEILAATGATVTSAGAVITVTDDAEEFPSITAVAGGLTETIAAIDYLTTATTGGCQGVYSTTVTTNVVCDECDPIYVQGFTSTAPADFDFIPWEKVEPASSDTAKMGIRFTGKPFELTPNEFIKDEMPFYETSTEIKVAGGYIEEPNFSFQPVYRDIFNVKILDRKQDRDHLGAHLMYLEDMSRTYFDGVQRHRGNNVAKVLLGEESVLEFKKQYVNYTVVIKDNGFSQGMSRSSDTAVAYVIHAELGRHAALEAYLNKLANKSGLPAIQALGNIA